MHAGVDSARAVFGRRAGGGVSAALLLVEDDPAMQRQLRWALEEFKPQLAANRESALTLARRIEPAVAVMDLGLPPDAAGTSEGFALLEELLAQHPALKVVVLTGQNDEANALRAVALGAYDFLGKPCEPLALRAVVERAGRLAAWQAANARGSTPVDACPIEGIITRDPVMLRVCRTIEKLALANVSVLLLGESGTGKEGLARALHTRSRRRGAPFVAINCAAIPENLLEAELFGFERGAFTGATRQTLGKVEIANRGTLFLDEIGDLPHSLQAKLLRFLQERVIERVGGRVPVPVDVRVVSATHQNLREKIAQGSFREDLFFRLAEIVVDIPALRGRTGDAALLAHTFLRRFAKEHRRSAASFTPDALSAIENHAWPGNVRELENAIRRAVIMSETPRISAADLGLAEAPPTMVPTLRAVREQAERDAVLRVLSRENGNVVHAAAALGVSRPTLYDLMQRLGLRDNRLGGQLDEREA